MMQMAWMLGLLLPLLLFMQHRNPEEEEEEEREEDELRLCVWISVSPFSSDPCAGGGEM